MKLWNLILVIFLTGCSSLQTAIIQDHQTRLTEIEKKIDVQQGINQQIAQALNQFNGQLQQLEKKEPVVSDQK